MDLKIRIDKQIFTIQLSTGEALASSVNVGSDVSFGLVTPSTVMNAVNRDTDKSFKQIFDLIHKIIGQSKCPLPKNGVHIHIDSDCNKVKMKLLEKWLRELITLMLKSEKLALKKEKK